MKNSAIAVLILAGCGGGPGFTDGGNPGVPEAVWGSWVGDEQVTTQSGGGGALIDVGQLGLFVDQSTNKVTLGQCSWAVAAQPDMTATIQPNSTPCPYLWFDGGSVANVDGGVVFSFDSGAGSPPSVASMDVASGQISASGGQITMNWSGTASWTNCGPSQNGTCTRQYNATFVGFQ